MNWFRHIFNTNIRRDPSSDSRSSEQTSEKVFLTSHSLRQLNRMRLNAGRFLPGQSMGSRRSQRRRPAFDFREHRLYTPGDDVRFVDWKVSARQEHIFIRQGEQPKEATIYLFLDSSASMGWGYPTKSQASQSLSAALGFTALNHEDRLFFQTMVNCNGNEKGKNSATIKTIGPLTGKGQFPGFLKRLAELEFGGETDIFESIKEFKKSISGGGMTIIISDLLDCLKDQNEGFKQALALLPAPTWDVVILHLLHPEEINPSLRGEFELKDIETNETKNYDVTPKILEQYRARMQEWCKTLELACVEANAYYVLMQSDWELDRETIPHLRDLNILMPS